MRDSKEERLMMLKLYLDTRRGVGHTYAQVKGIENIPNTVVVVTHPHEARHIENLARKRIKYITWDNLDLTLLRGQDVPLVVDNHALSQIIGDALDLLRQARQDNYVLIDEIRSLRNERSM